MSTTLFVDTETTSADPSTARVVQLAMLLHDDERREVACASVIVHPGIPIPSGASAIHGITDETVMRYGIPTRGAVGLFARFLACAEVFVCYNFGFDVDVLRREAERERIPLSWDDGEQHSGAVEIRCAMAMASPICNMPATARMVAAGFGDKPKPPKLSEAYRILLGKELVGAHNALADARACAEIYYHLTDRKAGDQAA